MKTAVVGMGLIGGSLFKASQRAGHETVGLHHGDAAGFSEAELILVCLPPEAIVPWIRDHAGAFRAGATVVDICGVKRTIVRDVRPLVTDRWFFVGGHPMAGREVSGYEHSTADLFEGASMILTPDGDLPAPVLDRLREYFRSVGFYETVVTTPEKHDDMIALTSQLCHVIATTYARDPRIRETVGFSAGSYANMTRIATQDPVVWRELYAANRDRLLETIAGFQERLEAFRRSIEADDAAAVERMIAEGASAKRDELLSRRRGDERFLQG